MESHIVEKLTGQKTSKIQTYASHFKPLHTFVSGAIQASYKAGFTNSTVFADWRCSTAWGMSSVVV